MGVSLYNHERYLDPTAYKALSNIERERKQQSHKMSIELKKAKKENKVIRRSSTECVVIGGAKR